VSAAPVIKGYNKNAYDDARKIVEEGRNPTPTELIDLIRLMDFDSPQGEMKKEAYAIWTEMRSKGVTLTAEGYLALTHVFVP
jgi:hypothetical protein